MIAIRELECVKTPYCSAGIRPKTQTKCESIYIEHDKGP